MFCMTICLVESHSHDVHANMGVISVLPHTIHVTLTSVVHCHQKREYTCVLDCVSFIEILATINILTILILFLLFYNIVICSSGLEVQIIQTPVASHNLRLKKWLNLKCNNFFDTHLSGLHSGRKNKNLAILIFAKLFGPS